MLSSDPILRFIHASVEAGVPVYMEGPPGGGKTARVAAYGKATGRYVNRWLLSRCEAIDIKPRVYHEGHIVVMDPPEMEALVQEACKALSKSHVAHAIGFFDELNRAEKSTENAALDRIDAPPPGVAIVAAGNPPARGQAARPLGSACANRFCHVSVPKDRKAFAAALVNGWPSDESEFPMPTVAAVEAAKDKLRSVASAFIARNPDALPEKEPDDPIKAGKAWASERSWDMALKVAAVARTLGYDVVDQLALVAGCVGEGNATEFIAYCQTADLIDPEAWLANPTTDHFGNDAKRIDRLVAGLSAVSYAVRTNLTNARWVASWEILGHLCDNNLMDAAIVGGDMAVALYRDAVKKTPAIKGTLTEPHELMKKHTPRMASLLVP